jgi:ketosteroid isomerase-like protein
MPDLRHLDMNVDIGYGPFSSAGGRSSRRTERRVSDQIPVEDVLAVQDLLGRYCWYVDENRGEDWASLYTEDGVFEGTWPDPVCGRAALAGVPAGIHQQFGGRMRHQWGNLQLDRGGDHSLVERFYNQISIWRDGGSLVMMALSTARLVRTEADAPWRIQRNTIVPLG